MPAQVPAPTRSYTVSSAALTPAQGRAECERWLGDMHGIDAGAQVAADCRAYDLAAIFANNTLTTFAPAYIDAACAAFLARFPQAGVYAGAIPDARPELATANGVDALGVAYSTHDTLVRMTFPNGVFVVRDTETGCYAAAFGAFFDVAASNVHVRDMYERMRAAGDTARYQAAADVAFFLWTRARNVATALSGFEK